MEAPKQACGWRLKYNWHVLLTGEACVEAIATLALDSGKPTVAKARLEAGEMDFDSVPRDLS